MKLTPFCGRLGWQLSQATADQLLGAGDLAPVGALAEQHVLVGEFARELRGEARILVADTHVDERPVGAFLDLHLLGQVTRAGVKAQLIANGARDRARLHELQVGRLTRRVERRLEDRRSNSAVLKPGFRNSRLAESYSLGWLSE